MKQLRFMILAVVMLMGASIPVLAQQSPTSLNHLYRPRLWNPASRGAKDFNKLVLSHQQRHISQPGWRSVSQFLDFNSSPLGKKGVFGYGLMLSNDIEHTESRFALSGAASASVVKTGPLRVSVGINFGLLNWTSNYDSVTVFDRTEDILIDRTNFLEADAGAGLEVEYVSKIWDIQLGAAAQQLPRNLSTDTLMMNLYPHLILGGLILAEPIHNLKVGPSFYYKNVFWPEEDDGEIVATEGLLDVGLKAELDRQDMWFGASYRFNRAALSGAFGMQIYLSDSGSNPHHNALFVDLNAGISYPIRKASVFGPTMEVGLSIYFGREMKYRQYDDTLYYVNGSFWENDGNVSSHLQDNFLANSPPGTRGTTYVTNKNVTLTYSFPDPSLQYIGTTPDINGDTIFSLGEEWVGVDGFLDGIVHQVIHDGLSPDTVNVLNPEVLEALRAVDFIEFSALLKANEAEAFFDAEGMVYEGELGVNNGEEDTLFLAVVYNGADTIIGVPLNRYISNLELACLKLYAMTKRVKQELTAKYGETMLFIIEGEKFNVEEALKKTPVQIRKPRILPNHPHQDVFQINEVRVKFRRNDGGAIEEKEVDQEDESERNILETRNRQKNKNPLRFRDKRD